MKRAFTTILDVIAFTGLLLSFALVLAWGGKRNPTAGELDESEFARGVR